MVSSMSRPHFARLVCGLGISQIISWGALIYSIAVLGAPMSDDLAVSSTFVFGAFSSSLVVSGLVAPRVGKLIDRIGGRRVLSFGAIASAASLMMLSLAATPTFFVLAWLAAGVARAMTLYEAAFATLSQHTGTSFRNAVTAITLLGGLAGTVFFPLSLFGLQHFGWRATVAGFAAIELLACLPLHLWSIPSGRGIRDTLANATNSSPSAGVASTRPRRPAVVALSASFAFSAFITSAIAVHVIALLEARGLAAASAVLVASLIGPMQLAGRLLEFAVGRRYSSIPVGAATLCLLVVSLLSLSLVRADLVLALIFATTYGCANGIQTIVRGTVPAELFGREDYGHLMGQLAAPSFVARALAPIGLTLCVVPSPGVDFSVPLLIVMALLALGTYIVGVRGLSKPGTLLRRSG